MNSADTGMSRKAQAMLKKRAAAKEKEEKRQAAIARGEIVDVVAVKAHVHNSLFSLIGKLPKPASKDPDTFFHKNGFGLKFYRKIWARRYRQPCYWTVTKFKPEQHGHRARVWGILTWRGVSEERARVIPSSHKREWRFYREVQADGAAFPPLPLADHPTATRPAGTPAALNTTLNKAPKIKRTRSALVEKQEREKAKAAGAKPAPAKETAKTTA